MDNNPQDNNFNLSPYHNVYANSLRVCYDAILTKREPEARKIMLLNFLSAESSLFFSAKKSEMGKLLMLNDNGQPGLIVYDTKKLRSLDTEQLWFAMIHKMKVAGLFAVQSEQNQSMFNILMEMGVFD